MFTVSLSYSIFFFFGFYLMFTGLLTSPLNTVREIYDYYFIAVLIFFFFTLITPSAPNSFVKSFMRQKKINEGFNQLYTFHEWFLTIYR